MSGAFMEFGFGQNDKGIGQKSEKFKGETGRSYRLSFAWWDDIEDGYKTTEVKGLPQINGKTPKFIGGKRFYFEGVGYVLDTSPEIAKLAGQASRMTVATIVVSWPIDISGDIDMGRVKALDFKILPWIFSDDKYKSLTPNHKEFHFGSHDLNVQCIDSKFQKMTFSPCANSLLAQMAASDKEVAKKVVAHIQETTLMIAGKLKNEVGREMTIDKLREKLAGGGGGGGGGGGNAAAASAAVTSDIDNLVDDILG